MKTSVLLLAGFLLPLGLWAQSKGTVQTTSQSRSTYTSSQERTQPATYTQPQMQSGNVQSGNVQSGQGQAGKGGVMQAGSHPSSHRWSRGSSSDIYIAEIQLSHGNYVASREAGSPVNPDPGGTTPVVIPVNSSEKDSSGHERAEQRPACIVYLGCPMDLGIFGIYAGSFSTEAISREALEELEARFGEHGYIIEDYRLPSQIFSVILGRYLSLQAAEEACRRIKPYLPNAYVVRIS